MTTFAPPTYGSLDQSIGPYELQNCKILARDFGTVEELWDFGDCDSCKIDTSQTKIQRKSKDQRVRNVVFEAVTDSVSTMTIVAFQNSDNIRSIAMMGTPMPATQAGGAQVFNIQSAKIGGLYPLGFLDVSAFSVLTAAYDAETDVYTPGEALADGSWVLVDAPAGIFRLVGGCANGDSLQCAFTAGAIIGSDNRTMIQFGQVAERPLELFIRGLGENGVPFVFHVNRWIGTPSSLDLIGADDLAGQSLAGTLWAVNGSLGDWQRLSA